METNVVINTDDCVIGPIDDHNNCKQINGINDNNNIAPVSNDANNFVGNNGDDFMDDTDGLVIHDDDNDSSSTGTSSLNNNTSLCNNNTSLCNNNTSLCNNLSLHNILSENHNHDKIPSNDSIPPDDTTSSVKSEELSICDGVQKSRVINPNATVFRLHVNPSSYKMNKTQHQSNTLMRTAQFCPTQPIEILPTKKPRKKVRFGALNNILRTTHSDNLFPTKNEISENVSDQSLTTTIIGRRNQPSKLRDTVLNFVTKGNRQSQHDAVTNLNIDDIKISSSELNNTNIHSSKCEKNKAIIDESRLMFSDDECDMTKQRRRSKSFDIRRLSVDATTKTAILEIPTQQPFSQMVSNEIIVTNDNDNDIVQQEQQLLLKNENDIKFELNRNENNPNEMNDDEHDRLNIQCEYCLSKRCNYCLSKQCNSYVNINKNLLHDDITNYHVGDIVSVNSGDAKIHKGYQTNYQEPNKFPKKQQLMHEIKNKMFNLSAKHPISKAALHMLCGLDIVMITETIAVWLILVKNKDNQSANSMIGKAFLVLLTRTNNLFTMLDNHMPFSIAYGENISYPSMAKFTNPTNCVLTPVDCITPVVCATCRSCVNTPVFSSNTPVFSSKSPGPTNNREVATALLIKRLDISPISFPQTAFGLSDHIHKDDNNDITDIEEITNNDSNSNIIDASELNINNEIHTVDTEQNVQNEYVKPIFLLNQSTSLLVYYGHITESKNMIEVVQIEATKNLQQPNQYSVTTTFGPAKVANEIADHCKVVMINSNKGALLRRRNNTLEVIPADFTRFPVVLMGSPVSIFVDKLINNSELSNYDKHHQSANCYQNQQSKYLSYQQHQHSGYIATGIDYGDYEFFNSGSGVIIGKSDLIVAAATLYGNVGYKLVLLEGTVSLPGPIYRPGNSLSICSLPYEIPTAFYIIKDSLKQNGISFIHNDNAGVVIDNVSLNPITQHNKQTQIQILNKHATSICAMNISDIISNNANLHTNNAKLHFNAVTDVANYIKHKLLISLVHETKKNKFIGTTVILQKQIQSSSGNENVDINKICASDIKYSQLEYITQFISSLQHIHVISTSHSVVGINAATINKYINNESTDNEGTDNKCTDNKGTNDNDSAVKKDKSTIIGIVTTCNDNNIEIQVNGIFTHKDITLYPGYIYYASPDGSLNTSRHYNSDDSISYDKTTDDILIPSFNTLLPSFGTLLPSFGIAIDTSRMILKTMF